MGFLCFIVKGIQQNAFSLKEERQFKKTLACTLEENGIQKAIPVATKWVSTKPAGEGSGLGLDLDIVRKIIEKHAKQNDI